MDELIQCKKNGLLFFRNEKTRYWAENTVDEHGRNLVEWITPHMQPGESYLIFHPDDDSSPGNVPDGFKGIVFQFPMSEEMKTISRAN